MIKVFVIGICVLFLQGCITKIVTVPVEVAYKTTKGVVKGTAAVVEAVIPGEGHDDADSNEDDEDNQK